MKAYETASKGELKEWFSKSEGLEHLGGGILKS